MSKPFVITGTRFSGIHATASMFNALGMNTAVESSYSPFKLMKTVNGVSVPPMVNEASWLTSFWLDYMQDSMVVIQTLRHPIDVISCLVADPMINSQGPHGYWLMDRMPFLAFEKNALDRAARVVIETHTDIQRACQDSHTLLKMRVDDLDPFDLKSIMSSVDMDYMKVDTRTFQDAIGPAIIDDHEMRHVTTDELIYAMKQSKHWDTIQHLCYVLGYNAELRNNATAS